MKRIIQNCLLLLVVLFQAGCIYTTKCPIPTAQGVIDPAFVGTWDLAAKGGIQPPPRSSKFVGNRLQLSPADDPKKILEEGYVYHGKSGDYLFLKGMHPFEKEEYVAFKYEFDESQGGQLVLAATTPESVSAAKANKALKAKPTTDPKNPAELTCPPQVALDFLESLPPSGWQRVVVARKRKK